MPIFFCLLFDPVSALPGLVLIDFVSLPAPEIVVVRRLYTRPGYY